MIDINRIRENHEGVKEALKKKLWDTDFSELLSWDKEKKELIQVVEGNKAEMNRLSASVPQAKKNGEDVTKIFAKVKEIAAENAEKDKHLQELQAKIDAFLATNSVKTLTEEYLCSFDDFDKFLFIHRSITRTINLTNININKYTDYIEYFYY